jgi:hypothetical protein
VAAHRLDQTACLRILRHDAGQDDSRTQPGYVDGDVRGPARGIIARADFDRRHLRFRRNAYRVAPQIFVEHHIADHQHVPAGEQRKEFGERAGLHGVTVRCGSDRALPGGA